MPQTEKVLESLFFSQFIYVFNELWLWSTSFTNFHTLFIILFFFHVSFRCIFPQRELHDSYDFNFALPIFLSGLHSFIFLSYLFPRALPFSSFSFIFQCLTHSYTLSPLGFMCSFICLFCWFLCFSHRFTFVFTFIAFSSFFCIDFHANHKFTYVSSKCFSSFSFALIFRQFTLILFIL